MSGLRSGQPIRLEPGSTGAASGRRSWFDAEESGDLGNLDADPMNQVK